MGVFFMMWDLTRMSKNKKNIYALRVNLRFLIEPDVCIVLRLAFAAGILLNVLSSSSEASEPR